MATNGTISPVRGTSVLAEARRLSDLGFNVLPTRRGKKSPAFAWKQFQRERTDHMVDQWWSPSSSYVGIFTACGAISQLIVLDCDSPEAERLWRAQIGPEMDATTCVKTSKGYHYWFKLAPQQIVQSWNYHEDGVKFDVQGEGKGVMTPPSPHPDGGYYSWVREPEFMQPAPSALINGPSGLGRILDFGRSESTNGTDLVNPSITSILSSLLANPPEVGGRNVWLAKVAGHLAKLIPYPDAYRALVGLANNSLRVPLSAEESLATANSVWNMERSKTINTIEGLRAQGIVSVEANPTESNGWLIGTGNMIFAPALVANGNKKIETLAAWSDFDIEVLGIVENGEGVDYFVELTTQHDARAILLKGHTLGNASALVSWLAERRATIIPPDGDVHKRAGIAARLARYVKSQPAQTYRVTKVLGWDEENQLFICHEGTIHAGSTSLGAFGEVRPLPELSINGWAPFRYGFCGSLKEAQEVLRQVMTFHDETVCAVFGAWWALSFLHIQVMQRASVFPFMALEAPSGSGKSTGFFAAMVQMSGNTEGHGQYTAPSLRDRIASHNAGLVWIDDVTDLSDVLDLIRQATSGGSRSKKSNDKHDNESVKLVSPIVLSGEGIAGLAEEKALGDRAVRLNIPSPDKRKSLQDASRSQWDDVTSLAKRWNNDYTQLSGWYVASALECQDLIDRWPEFRPPDILGRFSDSLTALRVGARILERMMGIEPENEYVSGRVDQWVENQVDQYRPNANLLINRILPWALLQSDRIHRGPACGPMIFVDEHRVVWYNENKLGDAWNKQNHITERERQLATRQSLRSQRESAMGKGTGTPLRYPGGRLRYHEVPVDISKYVLESAGVDL